MQDPKHVIRQSLEKSGLGLSRIDDIFGGAQIFGSTGILNSLEFVQFLASVSEELDIDVFEMIGDFDLTTSTAFNNISGLCSFIENKIQP
ncbi:hypothetical protein NIBR502774_18470 (plasmid) [Rhizobium sp. NIBRBAC000502774]|nr:hypothetical protein NIBR502774_18470 [Rhizobium sp. NIBRBAC000502774]